jgi:transposase
MLKPGDQCPKCLRGKVYEKEPERILRLFGQAPIGANLYELQRLRCNLCGVVHVAEAPEGIGKEKYDATAEAMIAVVKYGAGLPFNRLQGLQSNMGIPLPASTQSEIVAGAAEKVEPVVEELIRQAAQGDVVHNDDTGMRVLELATPGDSAEPVQGEDERERTGVFTSGIVSVAGDHKIALYFTGKKHAGENLARVLKERAEGRPEPIQMCDPLSRNTPPELKTIIANCLAHGRRQFADVALRFPDECRYVLEQLSEVYRVDALARERNLNAQERLLLHQAESGPVMKELRAWFDQQFEERKVEPNSGLGKAIKYMTKRWERLTLFLSQPGAPLDNNICERALKKVILHRKNAYFYKTLRGAHVGDVFMTLIHTAELAKVGAFEYLTALLQNRASVRTNPERWLPWNYKQARDPPGEVKSP